jgi:hypothetical protein
MLDTKPLSGVNSTSRTGIGQQAGFEPVVVQVECPLVELVGTSGEDHRFEEVLDQ